MRDFQENLSVENFLKIQCEHWYNVQLSFEVDVSYMVKDETVNEAALRDKEAAANEDLEAMADEMVDLVNPSDVVCDSRVD